MQKNNQQPCYWCMEKRKIVANINCVVCGGKGYFEKCTCKECEGGEYCEEHNDEHFEELEPYDDEDQRTLRSMQYGAR